jgi:D-alanine transaminase
VRTAPKSNYILPSITRDVVLDLCAAAGIAVREVPLFSHEIARASEIFLVGTTVEVAAVVKLDGAAVGSGAPGGITRKLQSLFRERVGHGAGLA